MTDAPQGSTQPRPAGLVAGFDAGQTHTSCRLADARTLTVLAEGQGPGVSHLAAPQGIARFGEALTQSLAAARGQLPAHNQQPLPLLAAGIGASGIEQGSPVQHQGHELAAAALELPIDRVHVSGDERTALRGAMGHQNAGIVVISGTGTIAVGRNRTGQEHRCAGWGWLLDGAGSAMDLGRDGLALSLQMADGRLVDGPLRDRIWQALALNPADAGSAQAIKALVVEPSFGAAGFARLAPVVAELAENGDPHAQAVVQRSADALAAMVGAIARRLELSHPPVWALGGALLHLKPLRDRFASALAADCPGAHLANPAGDACDGALILALELIRPR